MATSSGLTYRVKLKFGNLPLTSDYYWMVITQTSHVPEQLKSGHEETYSCHSGRKMKTPEQGAAIDRLIRYHQRLSVLQ